MPEAARSAVARGLGICAGRLLARGIGEGPTVLGLLAAAPAELRQSALLPGVGTGLADGGREPRIPEQLPGGLLGVRPVPVVAGFVGRVRELYGDEAETWLARAERSVPPARSAAWREVVVGAVAGAVETAAVPSASW